MSSPHHVPAPTPSTSSMASFAARRDVAAISSDTQTVFSYVSSLLFAPFGSLISISSTMQCCSPSVNTIIPLLPPRPLRPRRLHPQSHPFAYQHPVSLLREAPSTPSSARFAGRIHVPCNTCSRHHRFDIIPCGDHALWPHPRRNPRTRRGECSSITWVQGSLLIHPSNTNKSRLWKTLRPSPRTLFAESLSSLLWTAEPPLASITLTNLKLTYSIRFSSHAVSVFRFVLVLVLVLVLQRRVCSAHLITFDKVMLCTSLHHVTTIVASASAPFSLC
jgi:hypothetical protein